MSSRIRILPDEVVNRIAAGEVVERPASVVKELVENAIDAGSDRVVVDVTAGGRESIRVSDNGCGMSRDEALLSLERHATSKIFDLSDLRTLRTLGFRGEALPSIAAVSRMALETRPKLSDEATRIDIEGGRIRDVAPAGRGSGTTVSIHGLFFNVPARRKFLKATETELRHIVNAVTGLALAYPEVAFVLNHNRRGILNLERSDRERRIESIFGVHLGREEIYVSGGDSGVQIWGFLGRPDSARRSGAQQVLIVNGRWIHHRPITYAVYDGYGGLLPKGLSPPFAVYLEVDPSRLDVNVHPSKREVRFSDERTVYRCVADTVRKSLREAGVIPEIGPADFGPAAARPASAEAAMPSLRVGGDYGSTAEHPESGHAVAEGPREVYRPEPLGLDGGAQMALPLTQSRPAVGRSTDRDTGPETEELVREDGSQVSVWQLHGRYVLAHIKNGLVVMDQQAAHERILYEQTLDQLQMAPATGQRLLFPLTIDFGLREIQTVREIMPLLEKIGFGIRDFGGTTVVVDAIPLNLKAWEEGALLREVAGDLVDTDRVPPSAEGDRPVSHLEHRLAASYASRASLQAGDVISTREMQALIDQLFATRDPFVSPYGRPTVVRISMDELDRRFGR